MKSIIVIGLGYVFLCIAVIGIVIPIWPTTPFVLISVACFSSSPNMRNRILRFPFFKEHIENYSNKKGLSKKTLITSLVWLWGMLGLSMLWMNKPSMIHLLGFIGFSVTIHLLMMSKAR